MALAMASYAIIQSLGSVNFANAIVRERNPDQSILDTAFTLNFIRSVLVGSAVFLVAYFWGGLWLPREAQVLLMTMAVLPLIGGFYSPRLALVEADMRYGKIMVASSLSKVVSVAVGVSVAVLYQNYWAFFAALLSLRMLEVLTSIAVAPYRPRFFFSGARKLFNFSVWLLGAEIVVYFERQVGILVIGSKFGVVPASYLSVSRDLTYIVSDDILLSMTRVLYPALSKFNEEAEKFRRNAIKSLELAYIISVPLCFGLAAVAEPAIRLIMTDKFVPAILLVQIIASTYALQAVASPTTACALAANKTKWLFMARICSAILSIPILILFIVGFGLTGAAIGIGIGFVISGIIHAILFAKIVDAKITKIIFLSWKTLCAGIAMVVVIHYLYPFLQIDSIDAPLVVSLAIELCFKVMIGCATYVSEIFCDVVHFRRSRHGRTRNISVL